jgi:hypothetical protein
MRSSVPAIHKAKYKNWNSLARDVLGGVTALLSQTDLEEKSSWKCGIGFASVLSAGKNKDIASYQELCCLI